MDKILIFTLFIFLLGCNDSREVKPIVLNDVEHNEEVKLIVNSWQNAHSKQDLKMLSRFYADSVIFYRNKFSKNDCLKQKEIAFSNIKSKYSTEVFGDIEIEKRSKGNIICTFLKRASIGSKIYDYYAYLVFKDVDTNPKISIEGDFLTDYMANQTENSNYTREKLKGDFNGDGKLDYATLMIPDNSNDSTGEIKENIILEFSEPNHRTILPGSAGGKLSNLGDLNNDGSDELGLWAGWLHSSWSKYYVYTYKNGRWINAVPRFTIHIDQLNKGIMPIEKDLKNLNKVIIRYSSIINNEIKTNSKSVAII